MIDMSLDLLKNSSLVGLGSFLTAGLVNYSTKSFTGGFAMKRIDPLSAAVFVACSYFVNSFVESFFRSHVIFRATTTLRIITLTYVFSHLRVSINMGFKPLFFSGAVVPFLVEEALREIAITMIK